MHRLKTRLTVAIFALSIHFPVYAGGGGGGGGGGCPDCAKEWTQIAHLAKNAITATESVRQTATQIQQYVTQVQQLQTMFQNLKNLPQSVLDDALGGALHELRDVLAAKQAAEQLFGSLKDVSGMIQGRYQEAASANMSLEGWAQSQISRAKTLQEGNAIVFERDATIMEQTMRDVQAFQSLAKKVPAALGNQAQQQLTNTQLNMMGSQLASLTQSIASQNIIIAQERTVRLAEQEKTAGNTEAVGKAQRSLLDKALPTLKPVGEKK